MSTTATDDSPLSMLRNAIGTPTEHTDSGAAFGQRLFDRLMDLPAKDLQTVLAILSKPVTARAKV